MYSCLDQLSLVFLYPATSDLVVCCLLGSRVLWWIDCWFCSLSILPVKSGYYVVLTAIGFNNNSNCMLMSYTIKFMLGTASRFFFCQHWVSILRESSSFSGWKTPSSLLYRPFCFGLNYSFLYQICLVSLSSVRLDLVVYKLTGLSAFMVNLLVAVWYSVWFPCYGGYMRYCTSRW